MKIEIEPCSAPRMTRRDTWKKRPCVVRYFAFRDELRSKILVMPDPPILIFTIRMPDSWSEKKKRAMDGSPHLVKPDVDNLQKAVMDAMFSSDSHLWSVWSLKRWGRTGSIEFLTNHHTAA